MNSVLLHLVQVVMHRHEMGFTLQLPEPSNMLCAGSLQAEEQKCLLYAHQHRYLRTRHIKQASH